MAGYVADGVVRIGANRWVSITSTVVGLTFLALAVASVITTPDEEWDVRVVSRLALAVLLSAAIAAFGIRLLFQHERLVVDRSEEHTSELQSLMRNSYAVFCLKKKKTSYT